MYYMLSLHIKWLLNGIVAKTAKQITFKVLVYENIISIRREV